MPQHINLKVTDFEYYYVTSRRKESRRAKNFTHHGTFNEVDRALTRQLKRSYEYGEETSLFGVMHNKEVVQIN